MGSSTRQTIRRGPYVTGTAAGGSTRRRRGGVPPGRAAADTDDAVLLAERVQDFGRFLDQADDAPRARREKPKVSAFTSAKIDEILKLRPDFVIGFSDIQADIAAELVRRGVEVWIANHRSVAGILDYVRRLGALVGCAAKADACAEGLQRGLDAIAAQAAALPRRPKVYFEEWDEPRISGIRWVAELVRISGGDDIFPELAAEPLAKQRILPDDDAIIARAPDIVFGSWCGKKFQPESLMMRPGWSAIPAVRKGFVHEIKSADILQPGPSVITHGLKQLQAIIRQWSVQQQHSKHWS